MRPALRHIANLWTLTQHPTCENEWSLEQKLKAIKDAGFDGVCWAPSPELQGGAERCGLIFLGGMASGNASAFRGICDGLHRCGARHVNVQLATDEVQTPEALELTLGLMKEAKPFHLLMAIESHRGTCTETPEKMYALADAYEEATSQLLPISWDFSHFAVVKHLLPENFAERLLVRKNLIQNSQQFHLRPFNGHHVQVPVTDGNGHLSREMLEWLPFAESLLLCWLEGNRNSDREIFVCPELGPMEGGYALSNFPNSWEDAKVLRLEIAKLWDRLV